MNVVFNCDWLSLCLSQVCLFVGPLSLGDVVLPGVLPTNLFSCSFSFLLPKENTRRCSCNSYCSMQALELILCSYTMHVYWPETLSCSLKRFWGQIPLEIWSATEWKNSPWIYAYIYIKIYIYRHLPVCVCVYLLQWHLPRELLGAWKIVWWAEAVVEKKFPFLLSCHLQGRSSLWGKLWGTAEKQPI